MWLGSKNYKVVSLYLTVLQERIPRKIHIIWIASESAKTVGIRELRFVCKGSGLCNKCYSWVCVSISSSKNKRSTPYWRWN